MEQSINDALTLLASQIGRQVYAVIGGEIMECQIEEINIYGADPEIGVSGIPGQQTISYAEGERVFETEQEAKVALIESLKAKIAELENE